MKKVFSFAVLGALFVALQATGALAQGVTTGTIGGRIVGSDGAPVAGAQVVATHEPSGTQYGGVTRGDGRYSLPGLRVGGPYTVRATGLGFQDQVQDDVYVNLGVTSDVDLVVLQEAVQVAGIDVRVERDPIISSERTGAATSVSRQAISTLPTVSRKITDFTRLSPQFGGCNLSTGCSFGGVDGRLNNITVDGSYFNNSFGLSGVPGDRTDVAPISPEVVEQLQVNIAPYDVRQGNFVGASVNTVTRSGTNDFRGSLYYSWRDNDLVGDEAAGLSFDPGAFEFKNVGGWVSGPIIKDRVFFFLNYEDQELTNPGTTFLANTGGQTVQGNTTRVLASDLDELSAFLASNFDYDTGPYQGYDFATPATRFLGKLDVNINTNNKLSVRYIQLDSDTDVLASNSSSLGFGNRRTSTQALNFANTNYKILENIRSIVGELNTTLGGNMANNLIFGYTTNDESRDAVGGFFPMVDILESGTTYTTFGFEPFTPNNELRYHSTQLQDNLTIFRDNHSWTFGVAGEWYESENVFFPGSQSAYVYNSLDDFYTDANDFLANPNRTTSPVTLRRFQVRWSNIPGQEKPIQPLEVFFGGIYAQDEWQASDNLKLTGGLRFDVPFFGDTGFSNSNADGLTFRDEDGNSVQFDSGKLPDSNVLFSPRLGFNWDARGDQSTQVRGGTGVFTGRPAYVWISNQVGNTGVLTGFAQLDNTTARPFHPDPDHYKPTSVTGDPASSYELALTDPDFNFPQVWRSNIAVDHRLPMGFIGTAEFLYNRDVNGIYYINANLPEPDANFAGPDTRPRWFNDKCPTVSGTQANRLPDNCHVSNNIVLKNQDVGRSWDVSFALERPFRDGVFMKAGYRYGEAKNTIDPGSIAFGSWNNNQHSGDPNNPGLAFSANSPGHRFFLAGTYRAEPFAFGATTFSLFWESFTGGNTSYVFGGDINGDGGTSNDLIYIPRDMSEMRFQQYTCGASACPSDPTRVFTPEEQAAAWEAYIQQDDYLSEHRGEYVERGGVFLPMIHRMDFSVAQELFRNIGGFRNGIEIRADILNFGNLLNSDWGVSQRLVNNQPLIPASPVVNAAGEAQYRLRAISGQLMDHSLEKNAGLNDVWRMQFSIRYNFN